VRAPGLDGVRGLAVLAVLAFHEQLSGLPGGFLGVDVFFVLSGYLITDLLVSHWRRDGRLDLRVFWARRVRRLVPALAVVLVSVTAAVAVAEPQQLRALRPALLAAVTYTSNWWQALSHRSYFASFGPLPPLQHLWSLAIEEQFYLVWPLALIALLMAGRVRRAAAGQPGRPRLTARRRRLAATVAWTGAAASAIATAAGYLAGESTSRLYYGTDTRAAALLIGAALAFSWPLRRVARAPLARARRLDLAGLVGVTALIWAMGHLSGSSPLLYLGGFALVALAAGAVVVAAASTGAFAILLSWRPLRWLGVRSYGIYLWHWPVIALFTACTGRQSSSAAVRMAEAVTAIGIASVSWHCIEAPVIRDGFRATLRARWAGVTRSIAAARRSARGIPAALVPVAAAAVLAMAGYGVVFAPSGASLQQQIAAGTRAGAASRAGANQVSTATITGAAAAARAGLALTGDTPAGVPAAGPGTGIPAADLGRYVTTVGDSVMLASARALRADLPGVFVDARVGRQMSQGLTVVRQLAGAGTLRPILVVGLGTNGAITAQQVSELLRAAGPGRILVLVTTFVPRPWQGEVNGVLAAAAQRSHDVVLANWYGAVRNRTSLLWPDGVHPRPAGATLYARTVTTAVRQAAARLGARRPTAAVTAAPGPSSSATAGGARHASSRPGPGPHASTPTADIPGLTGPVATLADGGPAHGPSGSLSGGHPARQAGRPAHPAGRAAPATHPHRAAAASAGSSGKRRPGNQHYLPVSSRRWPRSLLAVEHWITW